MATEQDPPCHTEQGGCEQGGCEQGGCEQGGCEQGECEQGECEQGECEQGECEQGECNYHTTDAGWGDYHNLLPRLKRVEGQIRGIQRMVVEQRYCVDILTQISAAQAALRKVSLAILAVHTKGCVTRAIKDDGGQDAVDELLAVVNKLCQP